MAETLIVGVGGAGNGVCGRLARRLEDTGQADRARILMLDTDRSAADEPGDPLVLTATAAVLDAAYRTPERFRAEWLSRESLRAAGSVEAGARGRRAVGRFLLLLPENLRAVRARIRQWLEGAAEPRRVWVVAGAAGGTGSGQAVDLGYLLQDVAAAAGVELDCRALLFVPPASDTDSGRNSFATLTELHYFSDPATLYRAHLSEAETPFETRRAPYRRVALVTSTTVEGEEIPLHELQERASVYLLTAAAGDGGEWSSERDSRESGVGPVDADGNPQHFTTFGAEWVEYPEERLVEAVYRNLLRRSAAGWLHGDHLVHVGEVPRSVPLLESDALVRLLQDGIDGEEAREPLLRPVRTRLAWIHRAPPHQWAVMDSEFEALVQGASGTAPGAGRAGQGRVAERCKVYRDQAVADVRGKAAEWLSRNSVALDRVARVLHEAAAELQAATDPGAKWESALDAARGVKARLLWSVAAVRQDPFLLFSRRAALRKLAAEYERVAVRYTVHSLYVQALPFIQALRAEAAQPLRAWARRVEELRSLLAELGAAWADREAALLEGLRENEGEGRLALGTIHLPGRETPFVANTGWNLPYAGPAEETSAIQELRQGWIEALVRNEEALLAGPGRSALDGGPEALRGYMAGVDRALRAALDERLRGWLSATAFQRLAEQHREPVELEYHLRRLVSRAADLPALDPPHARPDNFPPEYELVFFGENKEREAPAVVRMVVDAADREHPTRLVPSRSPHYLTAIAEHPGFSLARCPEYHRLADCCASPSEQVPAEGSFSRIDLPWRSATLVTRKRLRDAADVLTLAVAFNILRPNASGEYPLPAALVGDESEGRFPLPGEFDRAVRQLAGDEPALRAVGMAVDRAVQARGVEWSALQLERVVQGLNPLGIRFPGEHPAARERALRLAVLRAALRSEDLADEYARTGAARETEWLRAGAGFDCPACGETLGTEAASLPGACPGCRTELLPHRIRTLSADGFRRIPNPYVVGTPLETRSSVFVGRDDIIRQVQERLIRPAQRTILILIGERRCGKTSALKQLQYRLEGDLTPLFIDMQGLAATDLPGFLWWLAWRMKEALDERGIQLDLPSWDEFTSRPPDYQFESVILPELRKKLSGGRVLLMLDEFEVLAQRVMNGTFDSRAFDYLRHLMQHSTGIEFLFSGTHVLRQFAANYVTFLFNIGVFLDVDFLAREDALRLIREPVAPSGVTHTPEAIDALMELAGSHPYFTQLFGFQLVERCNRLRKREIDREDVEAESGPVIAAASAHLDHVWGQLSDADRLLIAFFVEHAPRGAACTEEALLEAATREEPGLRPFLFRTCVEKLATVGLLRVLTGAEREGKADRMLSLTAEVYRQWLTTAHSYQRLREEGLRWA